MVLRQGARQASGAGSALPPLLLPGTHSARENLTSPPLALHSRLTRLPPALQSRTK